ncbi:SAVED domain-containing protein [Actinokineospora sp.]|uniref:SAVED domain-containing protein n=1 Tax=Actinokineospora sp. TaxID=1872133 RepID=UPI0040382F89
MTSTPSSRRSAVVGQVVGVRELAPVFISYRTSDGRELAEGLAWALRATGVPVWHDVTDLPPGDTTLRLREALTSGLSGAVLIVTPDMVRSDVVRDVEVPELLRLARDPAFTFAVGSVINGDPATGAALDFHAPDTLLGLPVGTLSGFKQYSMLDRASIAELTTVIARQRMKAVARLGDTELLMDIQTRLGPQGTPEAPLAVRTRPLGQGTRVPSRAVWSDLAPFLADLPNLLSIAGTRHLRVQGGAHHSIAFAVGAAVPIPSGRLVTIDDQGSASWGKPEPEPEPIALSVTTENLTAQPLAPVAVFVDLVPTLCGGEFDTYVASHPGRYAGQMQIRRAEGAKIPAVAANGLVADVAQRIHAHAVDAGTRQVHLFLRVPFPIAVLLGRSLNTLAVTLHELEDNAAVPYYVEVATVASGRGGGPVLPG